MHQRCWFSISIMHVHVHIKHAWESDTLSSLPLSQNMIQQQRCSTIRGLKMASQLPKKIYVRTCSSSLTVSNDVNSTISRSYSCWTSPNSLLSCLTCTNMNITNMNIISLIFDQSSKLNSSFRMQESLSSSVILLLFASVWMPNGNQQNLVALTSKSSGLLELAEFHHFKIRSFSSVLNSNPVL